MRYEDINSMAFYSIKDIENLSGIKAHTLRIWEKRYNIIEPKRTDTNIRYYDDEDLKKILNISVLNRHGYKISSIAGLPEKQLHQEILNLSKQPGEFSGQIESLMMAMIDFDKPKFDNVFNKSIMTLGLEDTMIKIIYPFFRKVGLLWQTGNINPAQEHFISNLIRHKIIVALEDLPEYQYPYSKSFCLFLPDGNWHELGLLFYSYFIKKHGHHITYLGSSLPMDSLIETAKQIDFDYLVTSNTSSLSEKEFTDFMKELSNGFPEKSIILLGNRVADLLPSDITNILAPVDLAEFKEILQQV